MSEPTTREICSLLNKCQHYFLLGIHDDEMTAMGKGDPEKIASAMKELMDADREVSEPLDILLDMQFCEQYENQN